MELESQIRHLNSTLETGRRFSCPCLAAGWEAQTNCDPLDQIWFWKEGAEFATQYHGRLKTPRLCSSTGYRGLHYSLLAIPGDTVTFGIRFLSAHVRPVLSRSVPTLSL
jgi:hypothetical protein